MLHLFAIHLAKNTERILRIAAIDIKCCILNVIFDHCHRNTTYSVFGGVLQHLGISAEA